MYKVLFKLCPLLPDEVWGRPQWAGAYPPSGPFSSNLTKFKDGLNERVLVPSSDPAQLLPDEAWGRPQWAGSCLGCGRGRSLTGRRRPLGPAASASKHPRISVQPTIALNYIFSGMWIAGLQGIFVYFLWIKMFKGHGRTSFLPFQKNLLFWFFLQLKYEKLEWRAVSSCPGICKWGEGGKYPCCLTKA